MGHLASTLDPTRRCLLWHSPLAPAPSWPIQMHANKAKFAGPGRYANEIVAVYLGKTAMEDSYMGLGTVTVAADGKSGTFALNDGKAAGSFDCGAAPAKQ